MTSEKFWLKNNNWGTRRPTSHFSRNFNIIQISSLNSTYAYK